MTKKVKYIFCINTGRSGSNYLSNLFKHAEKVISRHEMKPIGHSEEMRQYFKGNHEPMRKLTKKKLENIHKLCANDEVFIETSHMFIKGFGWILAELLPHEEVGIIILNRDKSKIVSSFQRIDSVALTNRGKNWMITPNIKKPYTAPPSILGFHKATYSMMKLLKHIEKGCHSLIKKIFPKFQLQQLSFFDRYNIKCLEWYVDEINALGEKFQQCYPKMHYRSVYVDDLNDITQVKKLFEYFNLEATAELTKVVGSATNLKENFKPSS